MEFPDLGRHCSQSDCKQLDFLPFTCDACKQVFCLDHRSYADHRCSDVQKRDKRVHVCPLCRLPVPCGPNEDLDAAVDRHIESGCRSEAKERRRSKRCSVKRCRTIELMPVTCAKCRKQYCLGHRQPADHNCDAERRDTLTSASMLRRAARRTAAPTGPTPLASKA